MMEFTRDHWRWLGAALAFGSAFLLSGLTVFGVLLSLPFLAIGAALLMKELTRPITWMIDALMGTLPGSGERPPIDLRLARFYVAQERLDDALAEYARVMKWHPRISEPYEETMILLARSGQPRRQIDQTRRRALRRLHDPQARAAIERAHRRALEVEAEVSRLARLSGDTAPRV